ncbi:unnamed protein product [Lactuca saligna]|uniref:SEC7 domain-containing protein n=1 Tax=Lactuca saligna TaxID=75948 RepID=A0AA35V804_LACSI|nr:unnamed protein product [Lactuca saligna]
MLQPHGFFNYSPAVDVHPSPRAGESDVKEGHVKEMIATKSVSNGLIAMLLPSIQRYRKTFGNIDEDVGDSRSYSVLLLNTDAHNSMVKDKISKADFIRNNRVIDDAKDLAEEYLDEVVEEQIADDDVILIKGTKTTGVMSIILRGANDFMLDEINRAVHDALCIVKRTLESNIVVAGGGAAEAALFVYLEYLATTLGVPQTGVGIIACDGVAGLYRGFVPNALKTLLNSRLFDDESCRIWDARHSQFIRSSPCKFLGPLKGWRGGLYLSRSIGDRDVGEFIIPVPHVKQVQLSSACGRLVISSDGFLDALSTESTLECSRGLASESAVAQIVKGLS